jgi:hypothetical protein
MSEARSERSEQRTPPETTSPRTTSRFARPALFRYYIHDSVPSCRLQLIGELTESDVPDLNGCWRTVKTTLGKRALVLDLRELKSVDERGKQWLAGMAQEGASCLPEAFLRDLVAGKHCTPPQAEPAPGKPTILGRLVNLFRGMGVAPVK